ncbi:MAG: hypothetical protein JXA44_10565 [Methanospirillaceae archaeon]|nr:hypothetical protein [Methanospirillaceae archaeon]
MKSIMPKQIIIVFICGLFLMVGTVDAIRPASAQYDQSVITSTIEATCIGTFIVDHHMEWGQTGGSDYNNVSSPSGLGEVRSQIGYHEDTVAADGMTHYIKNFEMDGSNVTAGLDNLKSDHMIEFQSLEGVNGRMLYDEVVGLTTDGQPDADANQGCVFMNDGAGAAGFHAVITAGSSMNVEEVAATMSAGVAGISASNDMPVNVRYSFDAAGMASDEKDDLATGSAEVFLNVNAAVGTPTPGNNNVTTYIDSRDRTMAGGLFDLAQQVGYTSTW